MAKCKPMRALAPWATSHRTFKYNSPEVHRRLVALRFIAQKNLDAAAGWPEFLVLSFYAPVSGTPEQVEFWIFFLE